MRIDSLSFYSASLGGIQNSQSAIARVNQQLVKGEKFLAPKDDPLATARGLALSDRIAERSQYLANQDKASLALNYENTVLQGIRGTLDQVRQVFTSVGQEPNADNREASVQLLRASFDNLLSLANSRDVEGSYIFAGDKTTTVPFSNGGGGNFGVTPADGVATSFAGSASLREVKVDEGRTVQIMDNLNTVLQSGVVGSDVLQTIDEAIARLPLPNGNASAVTDSATLVGFQQVIDQAIGNLDALEQRVGATLKELQDLRKTTLSLQNLEQESLSQLTELDQAAAIIELQTRQTTLQAASQAYARTSNLTLFNYMS